jgi:hypothetical protein
VEEVRELSERGEESPMIWPVNECWAKEAREEERASWLAADQTELLLGGRAYCRQ